jgi:hypothetical protein
MPLEVFYSYAHEDEELRNELDTSLALLRRRGLIVGWHDRRISAGGEWAAEIDTHVRSADIILLLISADFLASDYCWGVEMRVALERHANREAIVIPIILRPADWSGAPFAGLNALPRDARAVTSWANRDEALTDIARGIREVIERLASEPGRGPNVQPPDTAGSLSRPRVLDAALPSHVVKGRSTELTVLIRLPESAGLAGVLINDEETEAVPEDVRSKAFGISFSRGFDGRIQPLKVSVKLTSPGFVPPDQTKNVIVPPDADSDLCPFLLTPVKVGHLKVLIELQWEDALRGHRRLVTECMSEANLPQKAPQVNVVSLPVAVGVGEQRSAVKSPGDAPAPDFSPKLPFEVDRLRYESPSVSIPAHAEIPKEKKGLSKLQIGGLSGLLALISSIAAVLAIPGMPKLLHLDDSQGRTETSQPPIKQPPRPAEASPVSKRVERIRDLTSGQVNFGCDQTLPVETPQVDFGKDPRNIEAEPLWANIDNAKTRNQSVIRIEDSNHRVTGVKASGTITGLDSQGLLGVKNCPGGGHGELKLHVTWTEDAPAEPVQ